MLMSIYVYMYVFMPLSDKVVRDHDCFMITIIYMQVCMSLSHKISKDHAL